MLCYPSVFVIENLFVKLPIPLTPSHIIRGARTLEKSPKSLWKFCGEICGQILCPYQCNQWCELEELEFLSKFLIYYNITDIQKIEHVGYLVYIIFVTWLKLDYLYQITDLLEYGL